jgi:hypothetical protein
MHTVATVKTESTLAMAIIGAGMTGMQIVPKVSARGKQIGANIKVGTQGSFRDIKLALQSADPKLKGNKLTKKTNEIFFGESDLRDTVEHVLLDKAHKEGVHLDSATITTRGMTLRLKKPADADARGAKLKKAMEALAESRGISVAELEASLPKAKTEETVVEV